MNKPRKPISNELPTNESSEFAMVGALMVEPALIDNFLEFDTTAFTDDVCQAAFNAMRDLRDAGEAVDHKIVVAECLRRQINLKDSIADLVDCGTLSVPHVAYHARKVMDASGRRHIIQVAEAAIRDASDELVPVSNSVGKAVAKLEALGEVTDRHLSTIEDAAEELFEMTFNRPPDEDRGLPTGISVVDRELGGGLFPGQSVILAARPSVGKSAFALNVAEDAATRGQSVLFVSLEMESTELAERMVARRTGITIDQQRGVLSDARSAAMKKAIREIAGLSERLTICTPPTATVRQVRAEARMMKARSSLDLIVIDYLQLLCSEVRHSNANAAVTEISKGLKALAREMQVPVLTLSQFNRQAADQVPQLSHLRDSGSIEQDANVVLFLHPDNPNDRNCDRIQLIIAKRRNGPRKLIDLRYDGPRFSFSEPDQIWRP